MLIDQVLEDMGAERTKTCFQSASRDVEGRAMKRPIINGFWLEQTSGGVLHFRHQALKLFRDIREE